MVALWCILVPVVTVVIIIAVAISIYLCRKFSLQNIGINLNEWQYPIQEFSRKDRNLERRLKRLKWDGDMNISESVWDKTTSVVNEILETLLQEMKVEAQEYEGLVLDGYRKYGSAREGLKVRAPDEFDVLLEYHIDGLRVEPKSLELSEVSHPGLGKLKILNTDHEVDKKFKTWLEKRIIVIHKNRHFLDARILHMSIFESIVDRCRGNITHVTKQFMPLQLICRTNAPSINIKIQNLVRNIGHWRRFVDWLLRKANIPKNIDINIVPAIKIKLEKAKGPRRFMKCPRYAVVKSTDESLPSPLLFEDAAILWRLCISGYETHYMDLARKDKVVRYTMTACRIVKTFINKEHDKRSSGYQPLPISTFLSSYYLKNIALYCMLFTVSVKGVHEALGYFLSFLKISLEEENLPQFFRGNKYLEADFPSCAKGSQVNLFRDVPQEVFKEVRSSFNTMTFQLFGMYDTKAFESATSSEFRKFVSPIRI